MITSLQSLFVATCSSIFLMAYTMIRLHKARARVRIQNIKAINLYLDKKFILKLLTIALSAHPVTKLDLLVEELFQYFCLEYVAFTNLDDKKLYSFKSNNMHKHIKESEVKETLSFSDKIIQDIGFVDIKIEDQKQYILFKNSKFKLLAIVESEHFLTREEKETINNEISIIIQLATTQQQYSHG